MDNKLDILLDRSHFKPVIYNTPTTTQQKREIPILVDLTRSDSLQEGEDAENNCSNTPALWSPPAGILRQALTSFQNAGDKTQTRQENGKLLGKESHKADNLVPNFLTTDEKICNESVSTKTLQLGTSQFKVLASETSSVLSAPAGRFSQSCPVTTTAFVAVPSSFISSPSIINISDTSSLSNVTQSSSANLNTCPIIKQDNNFLSSSKDGNVTLILSTVPKRESNYYVETSIPLPTMAEVNSSLTNHLQRSGSVVPTTEKNIIIPVPSSITDSNKNSVGVMKFSDSHSLSMCDTKNAIKLDIKSDDSSNFDPNGMISLPDNHSENSCDISSGILIPIPSDSVLNKDEQSSSSSIDIEHIITIPNALCSSHLNIPLSLSLPVVSDANQLYTSVLNGEVVPSGSVRVTDVLDIATWQNGVTSLSKINSNSSPESSSECSILYAATPTVLNHSQNTLPLSSSCSATQSCSNVVFSSPCKTSAPMSTNLAITTCPSLDTVSSGMQSPAEILSQLSRAGALPAMTSSQVSSVLSALNSENHADTEADMSHHSEVGNQVPHLSHSPEKVSTLTRTEQTNVNQIAPVQQIANDEQKKVNHLHHESRNNRSIQIINIVEESCDAKQTTVLAESKDIPVTGFLEYCDSDSLIDQNSVEIQKVAGTHNSVDGVNHVSSSTKSVTVVLNTPESVEMNALISPPSIQNGTASTLVSSENSSKVEQCRGSVLPLSSVFIKQEDFDGMIKNKVPTTDMSSGSSVSLRFKKSRNGCHSLRNQMKNIKSRAKKTKRTDSNESASKGQDYSEFIEEVSCYKCKFCRFISLEKTDVNQHIEKEHTAEVQGDGHSVSLKCEFCVTMFNSVPFLTSHLLSNHKLSEQEVKEIIDSAMDDDSLFKWKRKSRPNSSNKNVPHQLDNGKVNNKSGNSEKLNDREVQGKSKIRVKNLESETITMAQIIPSIQAEDISGKGENGFPLESVATQSTVTSEDLLVTNLDSYPEQSTNNGDTNAFGYKVVDESNSQHFIMICEEVEKQENTTQMPRKRGRPKGSRNEPTQNNGLKMVSSETETEEELDFRCNVDNCAVRLRSRANIDYHRRCHAGAQYSCPECGHTHCHWNGMSTHLWRCHVIDMDLFSCDECPYKTTSYSKLINLHKRIHGTERPFLCDVCGKGFKNTKQLRNHKAIHDMNSKTKPVKEGECDVCGRTFSNMRKLRLHKDNVHRKLRPHLCSCCGYSAASLSSLKMHMRQHTGEKPFKCPECEYQTSDHNSLRRHKMRHSGAKPYKCPHCDYACIQSSTYKTHLKAKHPGLDCGLMFSCSQCTFHSVKEENYLAHLGEHKLGAILTNKKRKKTSDKVTDDICIDVQLEPEYVAHLVEPLLVDNANGHHHLPEFSVETVTEIQFNSEFEPEEITSDLQEPQELKFKIRDETAT